MDNLPSSWFSKHKLLGYLFLAVIFGAIVAGVYYWQYGRYSKQEAVISNQEPQIQDPTANWQTYTNSKYNFQVQYPSNWVVKEEGSIVFRSLSYQKRLDDNDKNCSDNNEQTYCLSETYGESVSFDAELGDRPADQLKGQKVFNSVTFNRYSDGGLFGDYTIYTTLKNGVVLAFSTDDRNLPYLDQILSTFKFTK